MKPTGMFVKEDLLNAVLLITPRWWTKKDVREMIERVLVSLQLAICNRDKVHVSPLGTFQWYKTKPTTRRSPHGLVKVPSKWRLRFRPSASLNRP